MLYFRIGSAFDVERDILETLKNIDEIEKLPHTILLKIGINGEYCYETTRDKSYRTENPTIFCIKKFQDGDREDELKLMNYLAPFKYPKGNEWFYMTPEVKKFLKSFNSLPQLRKILRNRRNILAEEIEIKKRDENDLRRLLEESENFYNRSKINEKVLIPFEEILTYPVLILAGKSNLRKKELLRFIIYLPEVRTIGDFLSISTEDLIDRIPRIDEWSRRSLFNYCSLPICYDPIVTMKVNERYIINSNIPVDDKYIILLRKRLTNYLTKK